MADRPSAAADFCNKICQQRKPTVTISIRSITRPARLVKDEIVAVVLALPEPLAVLALMNVMDRGVVIAEALKRPFSVRSRTA
jgi:hypothetical protein